MIVVDTSVWIEFLRQNDSQIDEALRHEIDIGSVVALSPVFGELLQGAKSSREEKIIVDLWDDLFKVNEEQLFILAGRMSYEHKLISKGIGLVDCAILAAARTNKLEIWSLDKKLNEAAKSLAIPNH